MKKVFGKFTLAVVIAGLLIVAVAGTIFAAGPLSGRDNATGAAAGINCGVGMGLGAGPDEAAAVLLGMTQAQIKEQRKAGKSLVQIAATKNISEAALISAIVADRQADTQKLLKTGTITKAQLDQCLEQMPERVKLAVNRTTVGPPEWAGANGKGQRGMMRQGNGNQANCIGTCGTGTATGGMMRFGKTTN